MKIIIVIPHCREDATSYPPYGALYVGTYLQKNGHEVILCNMDVDRSIDSKKAIEFIIHENPDCVGFSAIVSTTYRSVKEISLELKNKAPNIKQILGGQMSQASNVLLNNTAIDAVVIGEGEIISLNLIKAFENNKDLSEVKGIAYKNNNKIQTNAAGDQIRNMDLLPVPNWDLIDMKKYLRTPMERFGSFINLGAKFDPKFFESHRQNMKAFTIMTGRGCSDWCTFCSRNMKGLRKHSSDYLLDLIEELKNNYNVGYFTFGDESFVASKQWVYEFLKRLKERNLDILFYVLGVRVDTVDYDLLNALKENGCFMIEYGFEHGSQRMLDIMEKRTSVAENYNVYKMTTELGLFTVPSNVINMPGETNETIQESIDFLNKCNPATYFVNYAQAHPGTPLYDYALLKGFIKDEEKYLLTISDVDCDDLEKTVENDIFLNFSELPLNEVLQWQTKFSALVKNQNKNIYLLIYIKISQQINNLKHLGFQNYIKYIIPRIIREYNKIKIKTTEQLKKSKSGSVNYIDQFKLNNQRQISQIKTKKYTPRKTIPHEFNPNISYYLDNYGVGSMIRHPSLREIVNDLKSQSSLSIIRETDTKSKLLKNVHFKKYKLNKNELVELV